jgi:protein gp37
VGDKTAIEWTDASWTPIRAKLRNEPHALGWHCEHASEGCRFCYAESINRRLGTGLDFKPGHRPSIELFLDESMLLQPLRWRRPRMIFVCSMTDLFADFVSDEWIDRMFAVMALCPQHTFQVLTKRSARMRAYVESQSKPDERGHPAEDIRVAMTTLAATPSRREMAPALKAMPLGKYCQQIPWPLPNVWKMVSVEDQPNADVRIPDLLATRAAVCGVSAEPLLGLIDFRHHFGMSDNHGDLRGLLNWVILGGESGPLARPMHPEWARSIRDQCAAARVPFFFKQWGQWVTEEQSPRDIVLPSWSRCAWAPPGDCVSGDQTAVFKVGKKAAGRLLDGRTHDGRPDHGAR